MSKQIDLTPQQKALQKKLRISWYNGSIFKGRNLSPTYRYIYWYFLKHCCPRNRSENAPFVWGATHQQIAEWCGCSDQTVYRAVKELIKAGLISYITKGRKGRYSIFGLNVCPEFLDKQIDPIDKQNVVIDKQNDPLDKQIGGPSVCTSSVCTNECSYTGENPKEGIIKEENKIQEGGADKLSTPDKTEAEKEAARRRFITKWTAHEESLGGTRP